MEKNHTSKSYPVVGEGLYSYANNSGYQKMGLDSVKRLMHEEITKKLDVVHLLSSNSNLFRIADMGCSVGPNTIFIVQYIIEAVKSVSQSKDIEFEVFFNDHSANNFNTFSRALPVERNYLAAGLPGSFHERLFPKASLHFVHSSYAVHWLSKFQNKSKANLRCVDQREDQLWNLQKISAQFAYDFESFLKARAIEIVPGGFMALLISCMTTEVKSTAVLELLASSLVDMTMMGLVEEATVASFNIPFYLTSPEEVESIVKKNGCFKIEKMQEMARSITNVAEFVSLVRAIHQEIIKDHFGCEIIGELFYRFSQKLAESGILSCPSTGYETLDLFNFLRRTSG